MRIFGLLLLILGSALVLLSASAKVHAGVLRGLFWLKTCIKWDDFERTYPDIERYKSRQRLGSLVIGVILAGIGAWLIAAP
jgi:hypothetical protein